APTTAPTTSHRITHWVGKPTRWNLGIEAIAAYTGRCATSRMSHPNQSRPRESNIRLSRMAEAKPRRPAVQGTRLHRRVSRSIQPIGHQLLTVSREVPLREYITNRPGWMSPVCHVIPHPPVR